MPQRQPRVFISHSSADKPFVRVLVGELSDAGLDVWFDAHELRPGDSIVQGISGGLSDSDYLVIVLSPDSVRSAWVQQELNTALWTQLSGRGVVVLPVLYRDCEIPVLLRDRIYADFRNTIGDGYRRALERLLSVFRMEEGEPTISQSPRAARPVPDCHIQLEETCISRLSALSLADLRRTIMRLNEIEIAAIWHALFESDMYSLGRGLEKLEYALKLLLEVQRQEMLSQLIRELCKDFARILCR